MSYMSGIARTQQINNSQFEKSKIATNLQDTDGGQTFNIQLAVSQASAITKILPKGYSMHVDRTIKTKRTVKRKFTLDTKLYKSMQQGEDEGDMSAIAEQPIYNSIQTINYDEMIRKCQKILNLLRKNKNSWPFKEPVDPIAMGIPHYRDIITNPMDLKTVGQNLQSNKYSTMSQFYADIELIISNSYKFNKNNAQFYTLTSDFQKYYQKLKSEPVMTSRSEAPLIKKISTKTPSMHKKQSQSRPSELAQRKQVAMKLKYLPKEQLSQLVVKINQGENMELNLQTLPMDKIRFLQQYISKRQTSNHKVDQAKNTVEDQSSFQSQSES